MDIQEGIHLKMDVGVHKELGLEQEEYCFDISYNEGMASVLVNSKEQMISEKLKSLLRFGSYSTRYKYIFDICYLFDLVDMQNRINQVFTSTKYKKRLENSRKNWLGLSIDEVFRKIIQHIEMIKS